VRFDGFKRNTRGHGELGRGNKNMDFLSDNNKFEKVDTDQVRAATAT
jgi:hypothetical protein